MWANSDMFLGFEVARSQPSTEFSQQKYILDLLDEISITAAQPIRKLMKEGWKLQRSPCQPHLVVQIII